MMPKTRKAQFNAVFKDFNESRHRYKLAKGSAGSGKSFDVAQDSIIKLAKPEFIGANMLVVRKVDDSNKYSTFNELCNAIFRLYGDRWDKHWKILRSPMTLQSIRTGNEIIFRGMADMKQRERVKSLTFTHGKLTWIWCEEATELEQDDVEILDDRLRGKLSNDNLFYQMTMTFNPVSASHWIKTEYFDTLSPDVFTHHSTYLDNRFCDEAYHQRMLRRKERDPDGYRVYGLGEWGELGGQIFTNYKVKPEAEFNLDEDFYDAMAIGQDFGFNHANAILLLGIKDGDIYILDEIYEHGKDAEEIIEIADADGWPQHLRMWCDSADPGRIRSWRRAGYRAEAVVKEKAGKGSVRSQIDWLKGRQIFIHPKCINTIKEIQTWKWIKNRRTGRYEDDPVGEFDDAMAALRYGVENWRKSRVLNEK